MFKKSEKVIKKPKIEIKQVTQTEEEDDPLDMFMNQIEKNAVQQEVYKPNETVKNVITAEDLENIENESAAPVQEDDMDQFHQEFLKKMKDKV